MKTLIVFLTFLVGLSSYSPSVGAQSVDVSGETKVGEPGDGNIFLSFNSERSWAFRQFGVGPSTALELVDQSGLKNFIINTTGNVGIDVLHPSSKLHINGSIIAGPRITFGSAEYFEDGGSFLIDCNGSLRSSLDGVDDLGSSVKRWRSVYASNGVISTSDRRRKQNINHIPYGLKEILMLQPVAFEWLGRSEEGIRLGLIAQDVQKVINEIVVDHQYVRDEESGVWKKVSVENLGMYYSDLIPVMIRGMQEQQQIINEKDNRIIILEDKILGLETRLLRIEQQLAFNARGSVQ